MRDRLIVQQNIAARIAAGSKTQRAIRLAQENVAAFSTGEAQRSVNQRNQNFVENACRVKCASGLEEDLHLLQIAGGAHRNVHA